MRYLETGSTSPFYNLALEEALLSSLTADQPGYFLLWQNSPSVIIGRHQNALSEVNLPELKAREVKLVRRMTGGGAVYHDLGNLNFSFLVPCPANRPVDQDLFLAPLIKYLTSLGVTALRQGRNDLSLAGAGKFSGLAAIRTTDKFQVHGTILYDAALDMLEKMLKVDPAKYRSKGVESVRARVSNLKPLLGLDLPEFWDGLKKAYGFAQSAIPAEVTARTQCLLKEKYSQDSWNLGQSPPMDMVLKRRFGFGSLELHLKTEKNRIRAAEIRGDFLTSQTVGAGVTPEQLAEALVGLPADNRSTWAKAWGKFDLGLVFYRCDNQKEVLDWLAAG